MDLDDDVSAKGGCTCSPAEREALEVVASRKEVKSPGEPSVAPGAWWLTGPLGCRL